MGYILKEEIANIIKEKYKTSYIANKLGLSVCYISLILHRNRIVNKHIAYSFSKVINNEAEVDDYFDAVKK